MALPEYVRRPIKEAREAKRPVSRHEEGYLRKLIELLGTASQAGSAVGVKSHPALDMIGEYVTGRAEGYKPRQLSPTQLEAKKAGLNIPLFEEPREVTSDEAIMWLQARIPHFTGPQDYAAQLKQELASFEGLPAVKQAAIEDIYSIENATEEELEEIKTSLPWGQASQAPKQEKKEPAGGYGFMDIVKTYFPAAFGGK